MKKYIAFSLVLLLFSTVVATPVNAKTSQYNAFEGYEYNNYGESVAAPLAYEGEAVYTADDLGIIGNLNAAQDMMYDNEDTVYILDSGNGRILLLDKNLKYKSEISKFYTADGEEKDIKGAKGFTLDNTKKYIYIANTEQYEVLKCDLAGLVSQVIVRPESALLDTDVQFSASKVAVNNKNQLMVLVDTVNKGAFVFNQSGKFMHFFGSNPVVSSWEVIKDYFLKRFMTEQQRKGLTRITPTTFSNFDVDELGFIYTVTAYSSDLANTGVVRRLNYEGSDILKDDIKFGDIEWDRQYATNSVSTSFIDIDVDSSGYINLLDDGRGRIFQYTEEGNMIAVFGSYGEQQGSFSDPVAIETIGDRVFVLDGIKNSISSFKPTRYGALLREGFSLLKTTDTEASMKVWQEVLKLNTNSLYGYYGIGMSYDAQGEYSKAMEYFKLAGANEEYSKSFREYRKELINDYFFLIIAVITVLIIGAVFISKFIRKKSVLAEGEAYTPLESKWLLPIYTAIHPADGFSQLKTRKHGSYRLAIIFVALWFILDTADFFYKGFSFNKNRSVDYNFAVTLFLTVGLYVLFVLANWSVCTLLNGRGTLKDIVVTTSYALLPFLCSMLINIGLSNFITIEESAFLSIISAVGLCWSMFILFIGLMSIHQFGFGETVGSVLLTIFGMAIIVFLLILFYTLLRQTINFINSVILEFSLR